MSKKRVVGVGVAKLPAPPVLKAVAHFEVDLLALAQGVAKSIREDMAKLSHEAATERANLIIDTVSRIAFLVGVPTEIVNQTLSLAVNEAAKTKPIADANVIQMRRRRARKSTDPKPL